MNQIVLTEINLAVRLFQMGLLKYFDSDDLVFYITDLCFENRTFAYNNDNFYAKKLQEQGLLKIVSLNEDQMQKLGNLYNTYKPKFIVKTISALIIAHDNNLKFISEDELLRETARQDLGIRSFDKEWLVTDLISEISMMGVSVDIELVKSII